MADKKIKTITIQLRRGHSYPQSLGIKRKGPTRQDITLPANDTLSTEEKAEVEAARQPVSAPVKNTPEVEIPKGK